MDKARSILARASPEGVRYDPFPYIIIKDALPWDYYEMLIKEYPVLEDYKRVINKELTYYSENLDKYTIDTIPENYRIDMKPEQLYSLGGRNTLVKFLLYHQSQDFFDEVMETFKRSLSLYQLLTFSDGHEVIAKCVAGINTPLTTPSSVRGPHTDSYDEIYSGLFYFKHPKDESVGGDLIIYKVVEHEFPMFSTKHALKPHLLEIVDIIRYEANVAVVFINTPYAVHGVSVRNPSSYERRLVCCQADIKGIKQRFDAEGNLQFGSRAR